MFLNLVVVGQPFPGGTNVSVFLGEVAEIVFGDRPSAIECEVICFGRVTVMPACSEAIALSLEGAPE